MTVNQEGKIMTTSTAKKAAVKKTTATATANITAARKATAKKAPAKKAAAPVDKPKREQTFEERDWTYLDDKPPSEQHEILAREINRRTNLVDDDGEDMPIDPKQVQAVLAMFPHFQRSETNKNRSGYHALAPEIVHQRSVHMTLAHKEAREIMDGLQQEAAKKPTKKAVAKKTTTPAKKAAAPKPATRLRHDGKTQDVDLKPVKKTTATPKAATPSHTGGLAAPVKKARVTRKTNTPAPAATEAF